MAERIAPGVFVCCSVDLVRAGARVRADGGHGHQRVPGPVTGAYMERVGRRVAGAGSAHAVQVMQCGGGVVPAAEAARRGLPLDSGRWRVLASQYLGGVLGCKHVIATDIARDVVRRGARSRRRPVASYQSVVNQYDTSCRARHPLDRQRRRQHHLG
jgi:hypothetical protein